jgi:putative phosphoesterase
MKIAIISDSHDNLKNIERFFYIIKNENISKIICCGDVTSKETLEFISTNFLGEIFLVLGNAETFIEEDIEKIKNMNYQGKIGYAKIENVKKDAKNNLDFIFYGHTHKPWLEKSNDIILANPGNLAGIFYQPTFALLDTHSKNLELKLINN